MLNDTESEPFLQESERPGQQRSAIPVSTHRNPSIASKLSSHLLVALIVSFFWGALLQSISSPRQNSRTRNNAMVSDNDALTSSLITGAKYLHCGNSTEEARQTSCDYDILSNHWVPAPCMDQESVEEYQSDHSWYGYADEEKTKILDIKEMSEMPFYYTNMRDHILHCAMLWRKQFRAFFQKRSGLDSIIVDEEHTMHCSDFLVNMTEYGPDFSKVPIKVYVGFAGCYVKDNQDFC